MICIILVTSNSVGDDMSTFAFSNQYVFMMMYFAMLSPLLVKSIIFCTCTYMEILSGSARHIRCDVRGETLFLRVKKIYKKCINKLLLGKKRQICLSTALQQNNMDMCCLHMCIKQNIFGWRVLYYSSAHVTCVSWLVQGRWWRAWWGARCHVTACSVIPWITRHAWSPLALVRTVRKLSAVVCKLWSCVFISILVV